MYAYITNSRMSAKDEIKNRKFRWSLSVSVSSYSYVTSMVYCLDRSVMTCTYERVSLRWLLYILQSCSTVFVAIVCLDFSHDVISRVEINSRYNISSFCISNTL